MRLEQGEPVFFIQRVGLEVQAGGIDVRGRDADAVAAAVFADDREDRRFFAVVHIDPVAGAVFSAGLERDEAALFGLLHGVGGDFPLRLRRVHEFFVVLAVGVGVRQGLFRRFQAAVPAVNQKLFGKRLHVFVFWHGPTLLYEKYQI